MNDGIFFLWIAWMSVIVVCFFMTSKNSSRTLLLFTLLGGITLSPYTVPIGGIPAGAAGLLFALAAGLGVKHLKFLDLCSFMMRAATVSAAYGSLSLLLFLDPVWLIWDRDWMLAIVSAAINIILYSDMKKRAAALILGLVFGDIILNVLFGSLGMPRELLSKSWLDMTAGSFILIALWSSMERSSRILQAFLQTKNMPKEKQG
ncbi:hypothetical protein V1498_07900 [Peribacillus sp. SCS-26]|uniref:YphA family membrane protein n=1 Tax=Paraperibacillus marinus TaxID=3115295 RepID=UPI0039063B6D